MSKDNKKSEIEKEVAAEDVAIGGGFIAIGIVFLALIFIKGSNSTIVTDIKKEARDWTKTLFR